MAAAGKTIKEIVHLYIDEAELTTAKYRRLYGIAYRGVIELALDVTGVTRSCPLCVLGNKTAELPDDYIQWTKLGVLNVNGEVATLSENTDFTLQNSTSATRLTQNAGVVGQGDIVNRELYYGNFYGYGYDGVQLYGVSGNELSQYGQFKVDEQNGVIVLDSTFNFQEVILEYISVPGDDCEITVPIQAVECLIAWIAWKDINQLAASRKVSIYDKTERKRAFYREKEKARMRIKPFRIEEAYDRSQQAMRLVVKS